MPQVPVMPRDDLVAAGVLTDDQGVRWVDAELGVMLAASRVSALPIMGFALMCPAHRAP